MGKFEIRNESVEVLNFAFMTILRARRVTKKFGGLIALDELDIEIRERSIHSIIGP